MHANPPLTAIRGFIHESTSFCSTHPEERDCNVCWNVATPSIYEEAKCKKLMLHLHVLSFCHISVCNEAQDMYTYSDSSLANSVKELQCNSMFAQPIIKKELKSYKLLCSTTLKAVVPVLEVKHNQQHMKRLNYFSEFTFQYLRITTQQTVHSYVLHPLCFWDADLLC
jgi:hypothetical protein